MKPKTLSIIILMVISMRVISQEKKDKFDFRIGTGISLLGSGDMITFNFENEINYKLNQYLSSSASLALGRSNKGVSETASFIQGNLNLYVSPFKNNKKVDFRVGTGLSYYNVSDAFESALLYENGVLVDVDYLFDQRTSLGLNIIIENSFLLTDRFIVGLKLFTQSYLNGDINTGIILKLGLKI